MLQPGRPARVHVTVATLWTAPERVRGIDAPALTAPADVRGWVAAMTAADRTDLSGRTLSQLLLGERVLVEEVRDGWARVVAVEQPAASLDPRGYPGWVHADQLAPDDGDATGTTWPQRTVDATATALRDEPAGDILLPGIILGTRLTPVDHPVRGWVPVAVPGRTEPAWAIERDLAPELDPAKPTGEELVGMAERLLDVPYVWGGLSAYGIDCSGLVHLVARRYGVTLPRDAYEQRSATEPVPLGSERPGDLYFFARPDRRAHHVGFVAAAPDPHTGERRMVHACGTHGAVRCEIVAGERARTLVAAHRFLH